MNSFLAKILGVLVWLVTLNGAHVGATPLGCGQPTSAIQHLVVVVQENHSFDSYFGNYCTAPTGSNPTCSEGTGCCEAAPLKEPGAGLPAVVLTDSENGDYDPDHSRACEDREINGGRMDGFVTNLLCGNRKNFAVADSATVAPYWNMARSGALADHYFQPLVGASSGNDMYFARAGFVFDNNEVMPPSVGSACVDPATARKSYNDTTIGDLLNQCGVSWSFYAEGYQAAQKAEAVGSCPMPLAECRSHTHGYPCTFDPSDVPFQYYPSTRDNPKTMKDLTAFGTDLAAGNLPAVSFVKGLGFRTEHPGDEVSVTDGENFVVAVVQKIKESPFGKNTLILVAWDEGGGFFDHVAPPKPNAFDHQPYGVRLPFLALGPFARKGSVSHVQLEHSSVVKFIEWNWLGAKTGQLGTRDAQVNNIGSLLDSGATRIAVPLR